MKKSTINATPETSVPNGGAVSYTPGAWTAQLMTHEPVVVDAPRLVTIEINVDATCIHLGKNDFRCSHTNPVALALNTATSRIWQVLGASWGMHCYRTEKDVEPMFSVPAPESVTAFLRRGASGEPVEPFTFSIQVPESEVTNGK